MRKADHSQGIAPTAFLEGRIQKKFAWPVLPPDVEREELERIEAEKDPGRTTAPPETVWQVGSVIRPSASPSIDGFRQFEHSKLAARTQSWASEGAR